MQSHSQRGEQGTGATTLSKGQPRETALHYQLHRNAISLLMPLYAGSHKMAKIHRSSWNASLWAHKQNFFRQSLLITYLHRTQLNGFKIPPNFRKKPKAYAEKKGCVSSVSEIEFFNSKCILNHNGAIETAKESLHLPNQIFGSVWQNKRKTILSW
jgi:hypothetical protein